MPSRRSDRGGSLRRQLDRAEEQQPELREALNEVARANAERDYLYKVGWEEFDNLDTDTRQDLLRESVVFGGIAGLFDAVTSPRRLAVRAGARSLLSRYAPKLAKTIWGRGPSNSAKSLMKRIKKVREDRALSKQQKQERIKEIEKELEFTKELHKAEAYLGTGKPPAFDPKQIAQNRLEGHRRPNSTIGDDEFAGIATALSHANKGFPGQASRLDVISQDSRIRPEMLSLAERLLEAGERRGAAYLSDQEQNLKEHKAMKEEVRADNMYTATDEEYDRVFRNEKEHLKR